MQTTPVTTATIAPPVPADPVLDLCARYEAHMAACITIEEDKEAGEAWGEIMQEIEHDLGLAVPATLAGAAALARTVYREVRDTQPSEDFVAMLAHASAFLDGLLTRRAG